MQPCSSVSNGGGGLKLRAETSGHQQAETSSMQPCSSISDGEAGVEPIVETLELPDDLTSELQQPAPRRSRYDVNLFTDDERDLGRRKTITWKITVSHRLL
ncbi:hypothetical protein TNCT_627351 [Trichonephila clavata]|uniref:Uncharacterized protein n=1 Tax=Trichonephila clavata TaxID=2740835 RepID=A0A8X6L275_TRICU|nr:hypothetical protein TNCT_627351 [Trichonephila clavata]